MGIFDKLFGKSKKPAAKPAAAKPAAKPASAPKPAASAAKPASAPKSAASAAKPAAPKSAAKPVTSAAPPKHVTTDEAFLREMLSGCAPIPMTPPSPEPVGGGLSSGDYAYVAMEDGTAMITRYSGHAQQVSIPRTLGGLRVSAIWDRAFEKHSELKSLVIPDTIASIGDGAFASTGITAVTLPDSVTFLGTNPFANCWYLEKIVVSANHPILCLQNGILYHRQEKRLICHPAKLGTKALRIPDGTLIVDDSAFCGCNRLVGLEIPASVMQMRGNPFVGCSSLKSIALASGQRTLALIDGALYHKDESRLICRPAKLEDDSCIIPQGIRIIEHHALSNNAALSSVAIPSSVAAIGPSAFSGCSKLTKVAIPHGIEAIMEYTFSWCSALTEITLPGTVLSIGERAFQWCKVLKEISLPYGVAAIDKEAFIYCEKLETVRLSDSVISIGDSAFEHTFLKTVTLPDHLQFIGSNPFDHCGALQKINVCLNHPLLATIDGVLFEKQTRRLICRPSMIPGEAYAVTHGTRIIDIGALSYSKFLKSVTIASTVTEICSKAFSGSFELTDVSLPNSLKKIGSDAFSFTKITQAILPACVQTIGENPFAHCSDLSKIDIQPGNARYTTIDGALFDREENRLICLPAKAERTNFAIPRCVHILDTSAFGRCSKLARVTIPATVTEIRRSAFQECEALESVVIPDSVTTFGDSVFSFCKKLKHLTFSANIREIPLGTCSLCRELESVVIPGRDTTIEVLAFDDSCPAVFTVARGSEAEKWVTEKGFGIRYSA